MNPAGRRISGPFSFQKGSAKSCGGADFLLDKPGEYCYNDKAVKKAAHHNDTMRY